MAVAMVHRRPKYLIRWADYDSTHDTYEPECNLPGCQGLLDAFKARHRAAMRHVQGRRQWGSPCQVPRINSPTRN